MSDKALRKWPFDSVSVRDLAAKMSLLKINRQSPLHSYAIRPRLAL